jgi:AraC family ethanolamine operon transcriptional activator
MQPTFAKASFSDADALAIALNRRRETEVKPVSLAPFGCQFLTLDYGQINLSFVDIKAAMQVVGAKDKEHLEFSFLLQGGVRDLLSHGVPISTDMVFGFDPSREVHLILSAHSQVCVVQIHRQTFDGCAEALGRSDLNSAFLGANYASLPHQSEVHDYLRSLHHLALSQPQFLSQGRSSQLILEDFLPLLIDALPSPQGRRVAWTSLRRADLVKQAQLYMETHLGQPLTLASLCQALHTSQRPLHYGFQELLGVSPMAYLKVLRLTAARRQLRQSEPGQTTVADVASYCGFWSLGHFSRDYKNLFGELPSTTLSGSKSRYG